MTASGSCSTSREAEQNVRVQRICVVGNSGSGKTHLAQRLAQQLGLPHLELDALNHRAGWQEAPVDEFRSEIRGALDEYEKRSGGWVVDGNYRSRVTGVLDPDTYVWLDYSRALVVSRAVRRTIGRLLLRRELWNGNRERWRNLVARDPAENIILWSWVQHDSYRARYEELMALPGPTRWVRLRSPDETQRWLSHVRP